MEALATPSRALIDPVCRMTLTSGNLRHVRMVDGQAVYFCSAECAGKFDANPDRYHVGTLQHVELPLYGLLRCYEAVGLESRLHRMPGVEDVLVDPVTDIVDVTYDGCQVDVASLASAIEDAGYRLR